MSDVVSEWDGGEWRLVKTVYTEAVLVVYLPFLEHELFQGKVSAFPYLTFLYAQCLFNKHSALLLGKHILI